MRSVELRGRILPPLDVSRTQRATAPTSTISSHPIFYELKVLLLTVILYLLHGLSPGTFFVQNPDPELRYVEENAVDSTVLVRKALLLSVVVGEGIRRLTISQ